MKTLPFYIVDVFAEQKYQGNQLAVFEHDGSISTETMQAMAKEINFAETTFINTKTSTTQGYDVRIFTTEQEIPFAGHPTLGTAFVIREQIIQKPANQVILNLGVGKIPVDFVGDKLWMQQINPIFGKDYPVEELAEILGIALEDMLYEFPILEVSTGLAFLIIPVKKLSALQTMKPNAEKMIAFLLKYHLHKTNHPSGKSMNFFVFTNETYSAKNQLNGRMFLIEDGKLIEDSATGSANGCLLSYVLKTNFLKADSVQISVEQGYEIPRPSILYHDGKKISEIEFSIRIGGKVQWVSKGEWIL
ncbi:MAG: PhzF family phenazine biosynthesis protein [Arcicella sp.]|jgi:trans-2,3-dihydro-3-hydroxyanthranilate isomerase|nr:PhzF family phenazine biosynthesis protein [Arcicella sp.]